MKRENILITEDYKTKRVAATKFTTGNVPAFDYSIHFGEEGNDVTMQNCIIKDNLIVKCSPKDTYDFETGALIALMKMCGVDKVVRACNEAFSEDTFKTYATKYERELNELKKDFDKVIDELIEENEKLKLDCEMLQHGYNDFMFCGGRQNGKQYTLLVELFKKLDQKKVDAAYKEAYGKRIIWCTSQPSIRDQLDSLIEGSKYAVPYTTEWIKPPTKREEMWDDILACDCEHSKYVKVKKEDIGMFVKECNEKKIFNTIGYELKSQERWFGDDSCIFQIFCKPAGFICAHRVSYVFKDTLIDYLPPMRWDLFKKGRLAVKVTYENYKEFYGACEKELGKKPSVMYCGDFTVSIRKDDGNFEIFTIEHQKSTGKKVVNWEDVR